MKSELQKQKGGKGSIPQGTAKNAKTGDPRRKAAKPLKGGPTKVNLIR